MQSTRTAFPARIARAAAAVALALPLLAVPASPAYADDGSTTDAASALSDVATRIQQAGDAAKQRADELSLRVNRTLSYDPALIAAIGSQGSTGHWICCPGFSCAYGDAIIHGVATRTPPTAADAARGRAGAVATRPSDRLEPIRRCCARRTRASRPESRPSSMSPEPPASTGSA